MAQQQVHAAVIASMQTHNLGKGCFSLFLAKEQDLFVLFLSSAVA
jgi:hypothetical protein